MRHFRINRNLATGHVAGELASDNRLPRADLDAMIADGSIEEVHEIGLNQILSVSGIAAEASAVESVNLVRPKAPGPPRPPKPSRPTEVA